MAVVLVLVLFAAGTGFSVTGQEMDDEQLAYMENMLKTYLATNDGDSSARLKLANVLAGQGKLEAALTEYDLLLKNEPDNPDIILEKVEILFETGREAQGLLLLNNLREADSSYDEIYRKRYQEWMAARAPAPLKSETIRESKPAVAPKPLASREDPETVMRRATTAARAGKYRRAVFLYEKVLSLKPDRIEALRRIAYLHLEHGNYDDAAATARAFLVREPQNTEMLIMLARIAGLKEQFEESERYYLRARELAPDLSEIREGLMFVRQKQKEERIKKGAVLNPVVRLRDERTRLLGQAGVLAVGGHYQEAATIYERLIAKNDLDYEAMTGLAHVRRDMGEFSAATDLYNRALVLKPDFIPVVEGKLWVSFKQERYSEAVAGARDLLALSENHRGALEILRRVYRTNIQYEEAIAINDRILELEPENVDLIIDNAVYHNFCNRNRKAMKYLFRARDLAPDRPEVKAMIFQLRSWFTRIDAEVTTGKRDLLLETDDVSGFVAQGRVPGWRKNVHETGQLYETVLEEDPQSVLALIGLGVARMEDNRWPEAKRYLDRALELQPENEKALEAMKRVDVAGLPYLDVRHWSSRRKDFNDARNRFDRELNKQTTSVKLTRRLSPDREVLVRYLRGEEWQFYYPNDWTEYHVRGDVLSVGLQREQWYDWNLYLRGDMNSFRNYGFNRYNFLSQQNQLTGLAVGERKFSHQLTTVAAGRRLEFEPRLRTAVLDSEEVDWYSLSYDMDTSRSFSFLTSYRSSSLASFDDPGQEYRLLARYRLPTGRNAQLQFETRVARDPDMTINKIFVNVRDKIGDRLRYWINYGYSLDTVDLSMVDTHGVDIFLDCNVTKKLFWYFDGAYYYGRNDDEDRYSHYQTGFRLVL